MFDFFDPGKLMIVAIVALVVIGPKDLPRVLRTVGQAVGKMRRMAAEFQGQFNEALKEAELDELKKELASLKESAKIEGSFDPATIMREEVSASIDGRRISPSSEPAVAEIMETKVDLTGEPPQLPEPALEPPEPAAEAPLAQGQKG